MWFDLCLLLSQTGKRNFQAQKLKKKMEDNQDFSNPNQFSAILSSTRVAKPTHTAPELGAPRLVALEPRRTRNSHQLTPCRQNIWICATAKCSPQAAHPLGAPAVLPGDLCTYSSKAGRRTPHLPSKLKPPGPLKKALKMLFGSNSTGKRRN